MKENPKHIHISEYNYPLPDERIAKFPLPVRDQSKLLVYRHGEVTEDTFTSLPEYLPKGSLMIFNNTKVIQARLHFRNGTRRMALHDRQSEEMEGRDTETGNDRQRLSYYSDSNERRMQRYQPLGRLRME